MIDLAAPSYLTPAIEGVQVFNKRHARRSAQMRVFTAALSVSLAVGLTVPSSEIRAKAFRLGLIAQSVRTHVAF